MFNTSVTYNLEFVNDLFLEMPGFVEVREIDSNNTVKKRWFGNIEELIKYDPPQNKNVYIGVFTRRDTSNGGSRNVKKCKVLWADIDDDITLQQAKSRIDEAGLPPANFYINSGHGIHLYWLLAEPAEKEIIPLVKEIANRIEGGDPAVAEAARVMRLPGSMNVKNVNCPVKCEIIDVNNEDIYPADEWTTILGIDPSDVRDKTSISHIRKGIIPQSIWPCIESLLGGVKELERNFALGRITKYLQSQGYPRHKARAITEEWNKLNQPPETPTKVEQDFCSYWVGEYRLLGCSLKNPVLRNKLSQHCDRANCVKKGRLKAELKEGLSINNRLLNNHFKSINGYELIIYGILLANPEGMKTKQIKKKLTHDGKMCMSRQRMGEAVDKLKSLDFIVLEKKKGRSSFCKNKSQGTYGLGYTPISRETIKGAIYGVISPAELKVYVLLQKYYFHDGQNPFPSEVTMAEKLGLRQSTISLHLKSLEEARYLKRYYHYTDKGVKKVICELLV